MCNDTDETIMLVKCCKCGNQIEIHRVWYAGGCNDYGSFELKCSKCGETQIVHVGRDIDASSIKRGAVLIKRIYDN